MQNFLIKYEKSLLWLHSNTHVFGCPHLKNKPWANRQLNSFSCYCSSMYGIVESLGTTLKVLTTTIAVPHSLEAIYIYIYCEQLV